jgi:hypothetical protein
MKKFILSTAAILLISSVFVLAEGGQQGDWAEQAAQGYETKAVAAEQKGDAESAKIYHRMAQIKRDAGAASKAGKEFDWTEYHQLNAQLEKSGSEEATKNKVAGEAGKDSCKDGACEKAPVKEDPFLQAAAEYQKLGIAAIKNADATKAQIYLELADIKRKASAAAKEGKEFDWARYQELKGRLDK